MRIILPSFEILTPISDGGIEELKQIERAARTCYKSEGKITEDGESAKKMVEMLIKKGHEAMLEHSQLSVKFITDRGVSHELVRHRLCSFAQESTRWCDYSNEERFKFGLTFVMPHEFDKWYKTNDEHRDVYNKFLESASIGNTLYDYETILDAHEKPNGFGQWLWGLAQCERVYESMRLNGCSPQLARSILPNSLKTEIVVTANYREWRNILKLRTAKDAHPDMRSLMTELLKELRRQGLATIFGDIPIDWDI